MGTGEGQYTNHKAAVEKRSLQSQIFSISMVNFLRGLAI